MSASLSPRRSTAAGPCFLQHPCFHKLIARACLLAAGLFLSSRTVSGDDIFVTNYGSGTVGEYTTSGATVNASLVSGLAYPSGIAISGSNLFVTLGSSGAVGEYTTSGATVNPSLVSGFYYLANVAVSGTDVFISSNAYYGIISEYTTSGATVNASLITGLSWPDGMAFSGSDLFVVNDTGTIGEYTTSGGVINRALISGLASAQPEGIAISGSDLFVTNYLAGTVSEYTTSGALVNASLISGLGNPLAIAVSGQDLFVANSMGHTISEYTTSGALVNASLISGLSQPGGIAVVPVPSAVALTASNTIIITGGTGTLSATVGNSAVSGANNLNYTLAATVVSGNAALGTITSGTGSLAPSASRSCTVPATSTNLGVNTISLTASDPNSSNLSQTATATLTVYDHSNASLSSSAAQTTQTINFGNVLRGATIPSQSFAIYNLAANTSAAYTANLKLTGFSTGGDPAFSTNLSVFNGLAAGNGNTFTASLNTSKYTTTGINTVTMAASQLADDSGLPGAGGNNNGAVTVTFQGNVGNATADTSNSQTTFGRALTATVPASGSYANLESKTTATSGSGGQGMVGSTATILAGTNSSSSAQTVGMAWRTRAQAEVGSGVISDIVQVSGIALNGSSGQTAPFVLEMSYDSDVLPGTSAADDPLYLAWLDPTTGLWVNAVDGNVGTNSGNYEVGAYPNGDTTLGDWGVNTANQTVWAVVNHDGDFAVVPEPSTLALLGVGALGLVCYGLRRRWVSRTAKPAAFDHDAPAILAFPSQSSTAHAARRAA